MHATAPLFGNARGQRDANSWSLHSTFHVIRSLALDVRAVRLDHARNGCEARRLLREVLEHVVSDLVDHAPMCEGNLTQARSVYDDFTSVRYRRLRLVHGLRCRP